MPKSLGQNNLASLGIGDRRYSGKSNTHPGLLEGATDRKGGKMLNG
jgi:hypothetical protein